ncbi:HNH endonuclease [Rossellomorea aquimaris]|uniref:HNH nuclease domain-containing protein n=1 Tax=Rossellomorea aquimaris TaxID=189382 RepID=A0A1J6W343_9BACI|nr:HNH endonuclease signature motif containing protein [Rossellomorea aquimaris]OIU71020.1 hypothetical protein BHE18_08200 [Rossellomorea aquimaris]
MTILEKDLKILWGRAAGRCSYCNEDLTRTFEQGSITLGEMAHVIARSQNGPRGSAEFLAENERDKYENLILLCPTHHRLIDKAPRNFAVEDILEWKRRHEEKVNFSLSNIEVQTFYELCERVAIILLENSQIHKQYGPESLVANSNPFSDVSDIWSLKKLTKIIPNNRKIINIIEKNIGLLKYTQKKTFYLFKEHAEAFELNTQSRLDREAVPRFPIEFKNMIEECMDE